MQRVDFLDDLAEDAAYEHTGIPARDLERHAVSVADLRMPTDTLRKRLGQLVAEQGDLARRSLTAGWQLTALAPRQTRPFVVALLQVQELRLDAVTKKGGGLADGGARPSKPALLGVLARQYRAALRARRVAVPQRHLLE